MNLPDLLVTNLRAYFLTAVPAGLEALAESVRLKDEVTEVPCPRLIIRAGDPKRMVNMPKTSRVPITIELVSSKDADAAPDAHRALSGLLDAWVLSLLSHRRENPGVLTDLFLHDWLIMQPIDTDHDERREQSTQYRVEAIVTVYELELI